jgi:hypothetical protein
MNNTTALKIISTRSSGNLYNADKIADIVNSLSSLIRFIKEWTMIYKERIQQLNDSSLCSQDKLLIKNIN